jgi:hypothetical protein
MEKSLSTKGQVIWMDYVMALFIFLLTLSLFFKTIENTMPEDENGVNYLKNEANGVAKSLMSKGFPNDWNSTNVKKIGFLEDNSLSKIKAYEYEQIEFANQKTILGIKHNFSFFFINGTENIKNIGGICSLGNNINSIPNNKLAYYSNLPEINLPEATFFNTTNENLLFSNITNFTLIVLEDPNFSEQSKITALENFTKNGNKIILSGDLGLNGFNITFNDSIGNNINLTKEIKGIKKGDFNISHEDYILGNFTTFAKNEFNKTTIASFDYENGSVFYFANLSIPNINHFIKTEINGNCSQISYNSIPTKTLAKSQRITIIDDEIATLMVLTWQ